MSFLLNRQVERLGRRILAGTVFACMSAFGGVVFAEPPPRPMTFAWHALSDGDFAVVGSGEISPDTNTAFVNFLSSQSRSASELILSSDGGDLAAGLELGRSVRRLSLATVVGEPSGIGSNGSELLASRCSSACALAFLGGVERSVTPGSEYGVHQLRMDCTERWQALDNYPWLPLPGVRYCPRFDDAMSAFQSAQGDVSAYLDEMGVDRKLFARMADIPAVEVSYLSEEELSEYGVVTVEAGRVEPY